MLGTLGQAIRLPCLILNSALTHHIVEANGNPIAVSYIEEFICVNLH